MTESNIAKAWLRPNGFQSFAALCVSICISLSGNAAEPAPSTKQISTIDRPLARVLPPEKWQEVERSVDRALDWMANRQMQDGSFPTLVQGQPGVTSFATMAFLSRGHQPGLGPYGSRLNRAIDFVISCQLSNGLLSLQPPGPVHDDKRPSHTAIYNHAISGLMLGEVYGQVSGNRAKAVKTAIERALQFTHELQRRPKRPIDQGGWRYLRLNSSRVDSDLSVTGWNIMFLRSAKNGGFDVAQADVDDAVAYVRRLWNPTTGTFNYNTQDQTGTLGMDTRGMVGAGILSLSLMGQHETPMARAAGDWLLAHPYKRFGELVSSRDRFFYGTYYCTQAMVQLGGRYWEQYFPALVNALLSGQSEEGSWPAEVDRGGNGVGGGGSEAMFGNVYSSALAVLSLTPPYQLLPVYQR